MSTIALTIYVPDDLQEFLVAELSDLDFEAFEMEDDALTAYIPSSRWDDVKREYIEKWMAAHDLRRPIQERDVADENWNRNWEETIAPIVVEPFLIKPTWRDVPENIGELILLEIDPKMSFGTGYHESTRLLLRLLPGYVEPQARVLDAGTGTGILAIASIKLGARLADAFDVDPWSQQNAVENAYINTVNEEVNVFEGGIDVVPKSTYDVILANINLNVILGLLADFGVRLRHGGHLIISGILTKDRPRVLEAAGRHGFEMVEERDEGEWWAAVLTYEGIGRSADD